MIQNHPVPTGLDVRESEPLKARVDSSKFRLTDYSLQVWSELLKNKLLSVRRAQLLFFISVQLHVSVVFDYHRCSEYNIANCGKNIRYKYMHYVGSRKFTKTLQYTVVRYKIMRIIKTGYGRTGGCKIVSRLGWS
jgi:hypothetical protein